MTVRLIINDKKAPTNALGITVPPFVEMTIEKKSFNGSLWRFANACTVWGDLFNRLFAALSNQESNQERGASKQLAPGAPYTRLQTALEVAVTVLTSALPAGG